MSSPDHTPSERGSRLTSYLPWSHGFVQELAVSPGLPPYRPASQSEHTAAPPKENFPAGHMAPVGVEVVDPAGHAYLQDTCLFLTLQGDMFI
jgi:hypothetical protein